VIWLTFAYYPIAHMVWFWAGPGCVHQSGASDAVMRTNGFLFNKGALDFAGGTVVHINAGIAGIIGCILIGKRIGYGQTALPPHNVPYVMVGRALLWVGWFGFNVGSEPRGRRLRDAGVHEHAARHGRADAGLDVR
jgi:Amt family ammonium transporter